MGLDHHRKGISLHLSATTKKTQPETNTFRQEEQLYLSNPEPKQWISSIKTNVIKVDSTVSGIKYYEDNTYADCR